MFEDYGITLTDEEGYDYEFNKYLSGFAFVKDEKNGTVLRLEYTFPFGDNSRNDFYELEKVPAVTMYGCCNNRIRIMKDASICSIHTTYLGERKVVDRITIKNK